MPTTERAGLVTAENVADRLAAVLDDTFARAHARHQAERAAARDDPYELSPSTLGGCIRQAAYRLAGTPPTNPEPAVPRPGAVSRAALIGTWIHAGMLPVLAESLDAAGLGPATVETPVTTVFGGYTLTGHADLVTPELVIDLKTVREYKLGRIDRRSDSQRQDGRPDGPVVWPGARWQAGCYALGVHQARIRAGQMPPRWIAWPYLDRSTGEDRICVEPWTPAFGLEVIERFRTLAAHAADPDTAPRNRRGPGLDLDCDACPWRDRAWPVPPPQ
ncbi:MAG: hypothetical protein J2P26_04260, partial [Nocardiopsaceae bacterium]|nr:hypothetical protein [Nocardiopsaceae bacterium]